MKLLCPEVVQTSAMDCGPAAVKSLLEGFGISASYGRLREACQTDVDGTSIDTLEEVATKLGLEAEQIMLPLDHLLEPGGAALPAIVVVRLPNGFTHFVVAWRRLGSFVQLMDPATGRRWMSSAAFLRDVYLHEMAVPAKSWHEWATSDAFTVVLRRRLEHLGGGSGTLVDTARADSDWRALATLDAACRMVTELVHAQAIAKGRPARTLVEQLAARARRDPSAIPDVHWSARPTPPDPSGDDAVRVRGAVLVRVTGVKAAEREELPPDLRAALDEPPARPGRALLAMLRADGLFRPAVLAAAVVLAAVGTVIEAIFFRGLFDVGRHLGLFHQRFGALAALLAFLLALLLLELPLYLGVAGLGRRLEARLRIAFLSKIPRLGDRYFASRPTSDMAERSHLVHALRGLPQLALQLLSSSAELLITGVGLAWLDPQHAVLALSASLLGVALPLLLLPPITERDLRVRVHDGSLMRFYLDGLLGLVAVRAHGAERAVRREHEALLVDWAGASRSLVRTTVWVEAVQAVLGLGLAAWLLVSYLGRGADAGGALLLVYWALNLPTLGQDIAVAARQYPLVRNLTLRLYEPLGAREDADSSSPAPSSSPEPSGVAVTMDGVSLRLGGQRVLEDIRLHLSSGSHVAVVGPSGGGKSSLVGLLLGWHRPEAGALHVDGVPLDGTRLAALRRQTAWIDPAVQLWNRPLIDNLHYGTADAAPPDLILEAAELRRLLESLPEGLQTPLGEGGGLVSGGEGQRVRFARALMRRDARLVILDEPFRGLDRSRRRALYARARLWWPNATLVCITHDVAETRDFPRVLVVEDGRLVEDGAPEELAQPGSRYRALLDAEAQVRVALWRSAGFKRLKLVEGRLEQVLDEEQA